MKVSVLIPVYNRKDFLLEAVASILQQTHQDFHIYIYDDGSTDGTGEGLPEDDRISITRCETNRGIAHARMVLLGMADTEIACWQDSDDYSHPTRLAKMLAFMEQGHDLAFSYLNFFRVSRRKDRLTSLRMYASKIDPTTPTMGLIGNLTHPTAFFRKHLYSVPLNTKKVAGSDIDWVRRCIRAHSPKIGVLPKFLYYLRRHKGRITFQERGLGA